MRIYKTILSLILLVITLSGKAQNLDNTCLTHWGIENGLSNNYVTDIVQDGHGRIWIATENGLNLFDGYSFMKFNSLNSPLKHDAISTLFYDRENDRIWIGCKYGGLYSIDCSTFHFTYYEKLDGKILMNVSAFAKRADGGFWMMPLNGGIYWFDNPNQTFRKLPIKGLKDKCRLSCAIDDGSGILYVGTEKNGMAEINLQKRQASFRTFDNAGDNKLQTNRVLCMYMDYAENIWLGTESGLILYDRTTHNFRMLHHENEEPSSLISNHIYAITEDSDKRLYVGSDIGGISILNLRQTMSEGIMQAKFDNILPGPHVGDLSSGNIRSLYRDAQGNLWIGNYGGGIDFRSHINPLFHIPRYLFPNSEKRKPVWGICLDNQGNLWAGGENEIIKIKDGHVVQTVSLKGIVNNPYSQVFSMTNDGGEGLLLGVYNDGLFHYDTKNGSIHRITLRKANTDVITFFHDTDGSVLVGTEDGLFRYTANGKVKRLDRYTDQLNETFVYGICRDRQGKLWVATYGRGIFIFNPQGKRICRLQEIDGLPTNSMNSLFLDSHDHIWAATRCGLVEFADTRRPKLMRIYGYKESLTDLYVRAITEDSKKNIWISTNNGVSMWDAGQHRFLNYDLKDGMPAGNFIEGSALKTPHGTLAFGSLGGLCLFNPDYVLSQHLNVPVQITACKRIESRPGDGISEMIVPIESGHLKLAYDENSFTVTFFVDDLALSRQVEYAVKIEGFDDKWINTMGQNSFTLRNLPPGKYRLSVKARIRNQQWDDKGTAHLDIIITPPFWLSWPAKIIYLFAGVGIVLFLLQRYACKIKVKSALEAERKRLESEQRLNEERLRFYTNITHELRTPLTLIIGPLEDVESDTTLPSAFHPRIKSILNSAERLLSLINQLLDFRKTETHNRQLMVGHEDISALITEIGLRYKELNRNPDVEITISINTLDTIIWFDREVITTIIDNLMSNAVKYTPSGTISLCVRSMTAPANHSYTEIIIKDTGYGISKESLPHIFDRFYQADGNHQASGTGIGLAIVKSLTELHQAGLTVDSTVDKGTTFTLTLDNENTYSEAFHKEIQKNIPQTDNSTQPLSSTEKKDKKIMLVVEDNADIRRYIASTFKEEFSILSAANGKEGWEKARISIPDIIISDIMMPVMDGLQLCELVKNDMNTSHIPLILLTAKDTISDKETGYDAGADSYLVKPFSANLLKSRVKNLLEVRRKLAEILANKSLLPQQTTTEKDVETTSGRLNTVSSVFLRRFESIVEKNICNDNLDNKLLAERLGISQSTLYRKLKALTGISINEFIRNIRLRHALQLMLDSETNISTAAYQSGFNDLPYFRSCFKKVYGMTPKEYLEKR